MQVIVIVAIIFCALSAVAVWLVTRGGVTTTSVVTEEAETVSSQYRAERATNLTAIIEFWLNEIIVGQPRFYASDDYAIGYMDYGTTNGLLRFEIHWQTEKCRVYYNKHDDREGECKALSLSCKMSDEPKLVRFLLQVKDLEWSVDKACEDWATGMRAFALSDAGKATLKDMSSVEILLNHWAYLTAYMDKQKKLDPILTATYAQLLALIYNRYGNELDQFLHDHAEQPSTSETKTD